MSEYWKSTPKYWCKHCSTYVKDTPFERKQHESTGKHQGNLKRSLRGIQNEHEKGEREKEKAKAEVDRLNRVVGGHTSSSGPSTQNSSTTRKSAAGPTTAVDQKRQWAQLAEMGIQVPDNFKADMAMPGQWQTVSKRVEGHTSAEDALNVGVRKRKVEDQEDEVETAETQQRRGWGTTTRRYPEENDADLDDILSASFLKKEMTTKSEPKSRSKGHTASEAELTLPAEAKIKVEEGQTSVETPDPGVSDAIASAADQTAAKNDAARIDGTTTLSETPEGASLPVFKKRKVKSKAEKGIE